MSYATTLSEKLLRLGLRTRLGRWAAAFLVSRWLTRPPREAILRTPSHLGLDWEPLSLVTADGVALSGWLVTPPRPRATVLLFHGIESTRERMLSRIEFLAPAGYRCVAVDHRAHGESGGNSSSFGFHERHDVCAVLALARQHWPAQPIALLGMSMGAAAIAYAAQEVRSLVRAVILESLYHDVLTAFHNRLAAGHYPDYFHALTPDVIRLCEWRLGQPAHRLSPAEHMSTFGPTPVLLVTGSEDHHATPDEAVRLSQRLAGQGQLLLVPGAGHENVCEVGGRLYRQSIVDFLDRYLGTSVEVAA